jgi:hypothetical protein
MESYQNRIEYAKRYIQMNPSKHTEYVRRYIEKNRKKVNQQQREYYEKNKDKLNEKFVCEVCGGRYTRLSKSIHFKTNKHQFLLTLSAVNHAEPTLRSGSTS